MFRQDAPDLTVDLPNAAHGQQRVAESIASILLRLRRPENDVLLAGLVFIRGEQRALRGPWSLPDGHDAARARTVRCAGVLARLGAENVERAAPTSDHRPELANRWVPIQNDAKMQVPPPDLPRPTWLLQEAALPSEGIDGVHLLRFIGAFEHLDF